MLSKISYSRRSTLFIITIIFTLIHNEFSHATHLTGGEITYSCLGGNEYEINLVVFRDCGPANSNNTGFDNDGVISVYDMNNNLYDVIEHGEAVEEIIVNEFYFECLQIPDGVCTAKGTYNTVITLPNNDNGYKIVYQRCCRNSQVINLQNPEDMGSSLVAYVPPSSFAECNNSPQFDSNPPLAICLGADLEINQFASDIDGDSLVYSFTAPYHGSSDFSPTETYAPPYAQIPWMSGYSNNYPIDSDPVIEINDYTGIISGSPSQEGYYTIGIKVEEYRNGIYLGEILRDFLFLVTDCPEDENDNCIISGCTDYNAFNFSAEATNDDGSCDYPTDLGTLECGIDSVLYATTTSNYGFENSLYYSFEVDNDSELIINLYGDQSMFQPHILLFDGSQTYMQTFSNTQSSLINEDSINLNTGEYYMVVTQGDPFFYEGTLQDYYNAMETSSQNNGSFTLSLFSYDGICDYTGCTDYNAFNFSAEATNDDGSCEYPSDLGTLECGVNQIISDSTTSNFGFENSVYYSFDLDNDSEMIINPDGFSNYILLFDSSQTYIQSIDIDNYSNDYSINLNAGEYYMTVTHSPVFFYGSTLQDFYNSMETSFKLTGSFTFSLFSYDGICDYPGCIDSTAFNFNTIATIDDGSCDYPTDLGTLECGIDSVLYAATTSNYGFENSVYYSFEVDNDSELIINLDGDESYVPTILLFDSTQTYIQTSNCCYWDSNSLLWININEYSININAGEYYIVVTQDIPFFYEGTLQDYYNEMETNSQNTGSFTLSLLSYDGTCDYAGCIDATALNFNQQANIDDGSCEYPTNIGTLDCGIDSVLYFTTTLNYGFENSVYYSFDLDNDSEMIINLAGFSNYILLFDSSQTYLQSIQSDNYSNNYSINLNAGEYYMVVTQDNPFFYEGTIQNYYNIMKTVYNNIDSFALRLFSYDGTCNYPGCTDYTAFNFNPDVTIDNGSCDYPTDLGTLECGITYSTNLDTINGNYGYETFVEPQNFAVYNFSLDSSSVLEISYEIDIFNYEFGSCYVFLFDNYSLVNIWIHLEEAGGFYTSGDIPSQIDLPPGSYTLFYGNYDSDMYITEGMNINEVTSQFSSYSNDSEHFSFKMGLISYDGTCDYPGCIDSTALNFNTNATNDDGSCQYIYACTDESALNYNPDATTDNGSCDYPTDLGTLTCGLTYSTSLDTLAGNCNINYDGPIYEAYSFTIDTTSSVEISFYECILWDLCTLSNPVKILLFENGYLVDWWEEFPSDCYSWPSNNLPLDIVLNAGDYHLVYGYSNIELYEGLGLEEAISEFITATTADFIYYNASVTLQMELITYDGTCDYPGCIDSTALNFNQKATTDDSSCDYLIDIGNLECGVDTMISGATTSNYGFENSVYYSFEVDNDSELIINLDGNESYVPTILLFDSTQTYIQTSDCCYWDSNSLLWININEYSININAGEYYMVVTQGNPFFYEGTIQDYYNAMETNSQNTGSFTLNLLSYDGTCDYAGCIDSTALNFNQQANIGDGSCDYDYPYIEVLINSDIPSQGYPEGEDIFIEYTFYPGNQDIEVSYPIAGNAIIRWEIDGIAQNALFAPYAPGHPNSNDVFFNSFDFDNGTHTIEFTLYSSDTGIPIWEPLVQTSIEFVIGPSGCTDSTATNYNYQATTNDGSCTYYPNCQNISLPSGWSLFSSYMIPDDMDLVSVLSSIIDSVIIVKDNNGSIYLPEFGFNGIGQMIIGQGYQVKTNQSVSLEICGNYAFPEENAIYITTGWNMIGYLRTNAADASAILGDINASGNLIVAKDYNGSVYMPEFCFNGIGDMVPGQGYQIKVLNNDTLQY